MIPLSELLLTIAPTMSCTCSSDSWVLVSVDEIVPSVPMAMLEPADSAATTFAVSVTSADASMPSSLEPSEDTSLPSTLPTFVMAFPPMFKPPDIVPPASGNLAAMLFVIVVEKLASSPIAAANSFSVSSAAGAESTRLLT